MVVRSSELVGVFTEGGALTGKEIVISSSGGIGHFGLACGYVSSAVRRVVGLRTFREVLEGRETVCHSGFKLVIVGVD
jgi:hypothetical protein